jgi:cysteinyl-tRNA synthetase
LEKDEAHIKGLGGVTLRRGGIERVFQKGEVFPLEMLRRGQVEPKRILKEPDRGVPAPVKDPAKEPFWEAIHAMEEAFNRGLEKVDAKEIIRALLELDRMIWKGQQDLETREFIAQAREIFRELIVSLGVRLESSPRSRVECLAPLVDALLALREKFREEKKYEAADAIRQTLERADVIVEDTREGSLWRLK